jgi:hypothetical protein
LKKEELVPGATPAQLEKITDDEALVLAAVAQLYRESMRGEFAVPSQQPSWKSRDIRVQLGHGKDDVLLSVLSSLVEQGFLVYKRDVPKGEVMNILSGGMLAPEWSLSDDGHLVAGTVARKVAPEKVTF